MVYFPVYQGQLTSHLAAAKGFCQALPLALGIDLLSYPAGPRITVWSRQSRKKTTTAIKQKQRYRMMGDGSRREKSSEIKGDGKNFLEPRHTSIHRPHFAFQAVSSSSLKNWISSFLSKGHDFQVDVRAPDAFAPGAPLIIVLCSP